MTKDEARELARRVRKEVFDALGEDDACDAMVEVMDSLAETLSKLVERDLRRSAKDATVVRACSIVKTLDARGLAKVRAACKIRSLDLEAQARGEERALRLRDMDDGRQR